MAYTYFKNKEIGSRWWWDKWFIGIIILGFVLYFIFGKLVATIGTLCLILLQTWIYLNNRIDILEEEIQKMKNN